MSDNENFELNPQINEIYNPWMIIHIYNRSNVYHLTRQVLLDSSITQNTYCFFYHILSKSVDDFNETYGSFAFILSKSDVEADLYLNVDIIALTDIIKYIQTGKICNKNIYYENLELVKQIIDLSSMFGMPVLVSLMREIEFDSQNNNKSTEYAKLLLKLALEKCPKNNLINIFSNIINES